jgi:hypothetical protein
MKKVNLRLVTIVCGLALTMWLGCGGEDEEEETTAQCEPACSAGFTCEDGQCVLHVENQCNPACAAGFKCENGVCVQDTTGGCDPVCGPGLKCENSKCVPDTTGQCVPACGAGFKCENGVCVQDTTGQCVPACGAGFKCENGVCVQDTTGQCVPACGAGFKCENGVCVQDTTGQCDPACTAGFKCENGQCVPDTTGQCDPPCGEGFKCENGVCVPVVQTQCEPEGNVANLKACAEGPIDVTIKGATVTYLFDSGYFLQDASGATEVYVGNEWPYEAPAVGKIVDLHATEYGNYKNQQEITMSDPPVVTGDGNVAAMILDIVAGSVVPSEELESRIVKGNDITVVGVDGKNFKVNYGTLKEIPMRIVTQELLCLGATFDLVTGIVTHYEEEYRFQTFAASDLANINTTTCNVPPESDNSNWGFEEETQTDPPADFEKTTTDFTAEWTNETAHGGTHSCKLTWTSQDNQDLYQAWYMPAAEGQTVTFKVWAAENDAAGKFRLALDFYNENHMSVKKEYATDYTKDGAGWVELQLAKPAPAGTKFVRGFVRLYDETDKWDGDASAFIDDWSMAIQ